MQDQNHLTSALRAYAQVADPHPDAFPMDWNREGLPQLIETHEDDPGDEYVPTGNARFDAIVRAANPRFHYGAHAGYVRDSDDDGETYYDYIGFPPREAFTTNAGFIRTLAHELTHWTQGEGRGGEREQAGMSEFDRFLAMISGQQPLGYVQEELTAEIGATLLLDAVGEDVDMPARAHYIANWESAAPPEERDRLFTAAEADAKRAVNWLLSLVA